RNRLEMGGLGTPRGIRLHFSGTTASQRDEEPRLSTHKRNDPTWTEQVVHARRPAVRPAEHFAQFAQRQLRRDYREENRTYRVEARPRLPGPIAAKAPAARRSNRGAA